MVLPIATRKVEKIVTRVNSRVHRLHYGSGCVNVVGSVKKKKKTLTKNEKNIIITITDNNTIGIIVSYIIMIIVRKSSLIGY